MVGIMGGKPKTPQSVIDAERRAKEAEAKAAQEAEQAKIDEDYRKKMQRGKSATILTPQTNEQATGRTLLGG